MAQFGSGEVVRSFDGGEDFSLSIGGLLLGDGGVFSGGDLVLGPAPPTAGVGHVTRSMTFTGEQQIKF
jgi:hypothetical protein